MSEAGTLATLPDPTLVEESKSLSFRFSRRLWTLIGVATLIGAIVGAGLSFFVEKQYVVQRSILVQSASNSNENDTLVRAMQEILKHRGFAAEVKARTGLDLPAEEIKAMISPNRPPLSPNLDIEVRNADLEVAQTVSDEIVPSLTAVLEDLQKSTPVGRRISGPIVHELFANPIVEQVYVPWWGGALGGGVLTFILAFVAVAFRQYRQPVVSSARDVGEALDLPVLARITAVGDGRSTNPQDAVMAMLSAIERLGSKGPIHRLVVVGAEPDLERSKLVLALGCAIARNFDQPVALVDADLEHASLTKLVGASDEPGLSECLTGELRADQTLLHLENGHTPQALQGIAQPPGMMRVMPAGINRGGSLMRMRSNLHQVLGAMSGRYVVVIDGPQVPGPVPSTQLLALSDATLVVVTEGSTAIRDAKFTGETMRSYTNNPVGAVVLRK